MVSETPPLLSVEIWFVRGARSAGRPANEREDWEQLRQIPNQSGDHEPTTPAASAQKNWRGGEVAVEKICGVDKNAGPRRNW
jgi:hypothetical protein